MLLRDEYTTTIRLAKWTWFLVTSFFLRLSIKNVIKGSQNKISTCYMMESIEDRTWVVSLNHVLILIYNHWNIRQ